MYDSSTSQEISDWSQTSKLGTTVSALHILSPNKYQMLINAGLVMTLNQHWGSIFKLKNKRDDRNTSCYHISLHRSYSDHIDTLVLTLMLPIFFCPLFIHLKLELLAPNEENSYIYEKIF